MGKRTLIMILILIIFLLSSVSAAAQWSIPTVREPGNSIHTVVVMLPDDAPHPFLLDTGAGYTIIGKTTFETRIKDLDGVELLRTVTGRSASDGNLEVNIYGIPYVEFSRDCRVDRVIVGVIDTNELNLIGMNLFHAISPFTFDLEKQRLTADRCDN